MKNFKHDIAGRKGVRVAALLAALVLTACGGGGGNPGTTGSNAGTGTGGTTTPAAGATTLKVVDSSGKETTNIGGGQIAKIIATVTLASGKPAAGALVTFTPSVSGVIEFVDQKTDSVARKATDSSGVVEMRVHSITPTSDSALAINVSSTDLEGKTSASTVYLNFGAAPLTIGTLSFTTTPTAALPAFNTLSLNIPLTSGGQPVTTAPGLTMTSLCTSDGTATLVPGTLSNGIQVATYTNNGCTRGTDTITVSTGSSSQSISLPVASANIGNIQFVSSNLSGSSIVLKGSGGQGRSESAQLTFRVVDSNNKGLGGVDVDFSATTNTGGLSVAPTRATTDASGNVSTMVSSGTIPTPVRVNATATRNGVTVSGLSDALTVSTGLPIQKSMSMSADKYNIEGGQYDGMTSNITVRLADQYGNKVSDGTTINFVTAGGAVGTSAQGACTTVDGACTVPLTSQNFRPENGRVTVLAYAQGLEDFVDLNGDGQYTCTNYVDASGKVPTTYRPLVDTCVSGGEQFSDMGDPFLDANSNGVYESAKGDLPFPYAHASYTDKGDGKWGLNYIRSSIVITFSNSTAILTRQVCATDGTCRDWNAATDGDASKIVGVAGTNCKAQPLYFRLTDSNSNPLPAGTTIVAVDAAKLSLGTLSPASVPSSNILGGSFHTAIVKPDDSCSAGSFTLQVTTPNGKATPFMFSSQ